MSQLTRDGGVKDTYSVQTKIVIESTVSSETETFGDLFTVQQLLTH